MPYCIAGLISFAELLELGSLEAAHEHVLEKEVETIMRKSHSEHFKWLENSFSIPLTKGLESWPNFIELTERRNLLVHCDGVVSSQYLAVCKKNGVSLGKELSPGIKLSTSKSYISEAYQCLYEIGVKLTHVLWRKLLPDDLERSDTSLINISLELIQEKEYNLAKRVLDFCTTTLKKWGSDANRRIMIINRAQAYYHSGEEGTCNKILDSEDWSACGDNFKLCHATLKKDFKTALSIMQRIGKNGSVTESAYLEWPVLRELREQPEFPVIYKEIFGKEPVNTSELSTEVDNHPPHSREADEVEKLAKEIGF